jgi:hypothetical protein
MPEKDVRESRFSATRAENVRITTLRDRTSGVLPQCSLMEGGEPEIQARRLCTTRVTAQETRRPQSADK